MALNVFSMRAFHASASVFRHCPPLAIVREDGSGTWSLDWKYRVLKYESLFQFLAARIQLIKEKYNPNNHHDNHYHHKRILMKSYPSPSRW